MGGEAGRKSKGWRIVGGDTRMVIRGMAEGEGGVERRVSETVLLLVRSVMTLW